MDRLYVPPHAVAAVPKVIEQTFTSRRARCSAKLAFSYALMGSHAHFHECLERLRARGEFEDAEIDGLLRLLERHGVGFDSGSHYQRVPVMRPTLPPVDVIRAVSEKIEEGLPSSRFVIWARAIMWRSFLGEPMRYEKRVPATLRFHIFIACTLCGAKFN